MNIRINENIPRYEAKSVWKTREQEQERLLKQNHENISNLVFPIFV